MHHSPSGRSLISDHGGSGVPLGLELIPSPKGRVSESSYLHLLLDDAALGYFSNSENRQRNDDGGGTGVNEGPSDMNIIDRCFQI
ncbi:hypothetical protein TIFTF001_016711 [Ficus carica]|uniref:Uncharacterized protein n=1 Tax=Ficus carica TaxID=3494 RepID=A0AA88AK08_FICCA|nr:hypothetical protein TIFTF001_016711 [Ficus carica]